MHHFTVFQVLLTFMLSAAWHGIRPGYFMTFFSGSILTQASRKASFCCCCFFKCFWRTYTHVLFWGHCYPCFGFLMISSLGFKTKVGSILFVFAEARVMY